MAWRGRRACPECAIRRPARRAAPRGPTAPVRPATASLTAILVAPARAARAPQPPSAVQARALSRSQIAISWNAATGASGYRVLRGATSAAPIAAPVNFKANSTGTSMELSWDPVPGALRYDVINVLLPYDDEVVLGSTSETHFTHTTAQFGHWYQYKVRAVGEGATADSVLLYVEMAAPTTTTLSVSPDPAVYPGEAGGGFGQPVVVGTEGMG